MSPSNNWPSATSGTTSTTSSDPPASRFSDDRYGKDGYSDDGDNAGADGDFDDVPEDLESYHGKDGIMNHSKSSSGTTKKRRCCSTRRCRCCLCFLFVLVVVVVTGVTVAKYQKDRAAYTNWRYASLDAPPQDLPSWCSSKDPSSTEYNDCLLYCHPADCCTVPADYADPGVSCLDPDNPNMDAICDDYRFACGHLDQHDDDDNGGAAQGADGNGNGNGARR